VTILADRGFGDQKLYELLKDQLGFDFVIRFRGVIMELAPPRDFDPHILLPRDGDSAELIATKELVLLLGLAFNDLKALVWTDAQLRKGTPVWEDERNRADPYPGN
jgi:hypothetical protein